MKIKLSIFLLSISFLTTLSAQNLQLHYDFGRSIYNKDLPNRQLLTMTAEHFNADNWGSWFYFVDMDITKNGVAGAYAEIARELQFWKGPLSVHVEYNGGLTSSFAFNNAYLLGGTYSCHNADYSAGFSFSPMYKYIQKHHSPHNFQLTATWYYHFAHQMFTFSGFADFWREETAFGKTIFLSEPQFWFNLNQLKAVNDNCKLSIGTEVKLSNNFVGDGFYAIPTLAVKWSW